MFNEKELQLIDSLNLNIDLSSLSEDDYLKIEEAVSDRLMECFNDDLKITEEGIICESIIDKIIDINN